MATLLLGSSSAMLTKPLGKAVTSSTFSAQHRRHCKGNICNGHTLHTRFTCTPDHNLVRLMFMFLDCGRKIALDQPDEGPMRRERYLLPAEHKTGTSM